MSQIMTDQQIDKIAALVFKISGEIYDLDHPQALIKALEIAVERIKPAEAEIPGQVELFPEAASHQIIPPKLQHSGKRR